MNADEYKRLCDQPNAFSRRDLEISEKLLREKDSSLALRLSEILQSSQITRPKKHEGGKWNDRFLINLPEQDAEMIVEVFTDVEVETINNDGNTTPLASFYGNVADKRMMYLSSL